VFTENMPLNWHAIQRFLKEHEDGLRKNGRVCDKFIIAIPREFSIESAEKVLRSYGRRIGDGKAPFLIAFHMEENNPHAHMIFIDRDPATGRRVFGTSELRSTEMLKFHWAEEVNGHFAELGLDTRIEFGTLTEEIQAANGNVEPPHLGDLEREIAALVKAQHGAVEPEPEGVVSEALPTPPEGGDNPSPPLPLEEAELAEKLPPPEVDVDENVVDLDGAVLRVAYTTEEEKLDAALEAARDLRRIHNTQRDRQAVKDRYAAVQAQLVAAEERATKAMLEAQQAEATREQARHAYLTEHRGMFGKKGVRLSAFGYEYVSPARRAADLAEQAYFDALHNKEQAAQMAASALSHQQVMRYEHDIALQEINDVHGTEAQLSGAEKIIEELVVETTRDLTPERIRDLYADALLTAEEAAELLEVQGYEKEARVLLKEAEQGRDRGGYSH